MGGLMAVELLHGDCLEHMAALKAAGRTFPAIVTDPPYHLGKSGFMNKAWDAASYGVAFDPQTWRLALDLLEPGGMLAAFGGARTQHRMAVAIEDAGFTIFDTVLYLYGTGFPKAKTQLKPAYEPIILARKPTKGPLRALGIDACRVATDEARPLKLPDRRSGNQVYGDMLQGSYAAGETTEGRWPANILHDGSDEVLAAFAAFGEKKAHSGGRGNINAGHMAGYGDAPRSATGGRSAGGFDDTGTAARFFYSAKASRAERAGSKHPTQKPLSLMSWLVKLINPAGGTVLDPFAGSGTTGVACLREGFDCVLIEREAEYVETIKFRLQQERSVSEPQLALAIS